MNKLPFTQKVDHIQGLPYHGDTESELFDVIVNEMKIFEGVDENGEMCEYMYLLDDKKDLYKMRIVSQSEFLQRQAKRETLSNSNIGLIKEGKILLDSMINMIPFASITKLRYLSSKRIFTYYYFKCRKSRFLMIRYYLKKLLAQDLFGENSQLYAEVHDFCIFHKNEISEHVFDFYPEIQQEKELGLGRITSDDIEKGNEILTKVIAYLEATYPEQSK